MQALVKELIDVIGKAATYALIARYGGRELGVPHKIPRGHAIALTIGSVAAKQLAEHFGGTVVRLPPERHALRAERNLAIYRDVVMRGRSRAAVAFDYGLTRQGVSAIIRKMQAERGLHRGSGG